MEWLAENWASLAAIAVLVLIVALALRNKIKKKGCGCGCGEPETWDVDYAAYQQAKEWEEPDPSQFGVWVPGIGALIGGAMEKMGVNETVKSLVTDGAWGGVATVLGFVPVITIVFLFLAFLEDCGYMARVAFIMDRRRRDQASRCRRWRPCSRA